jgi:hypothetical protein
MRALLVVLLATSVAAADPDLVVTGRLGVTHAQLDDAQVDNPIVGSGSMIGAEVGLAFRAIHLTPSIALDGGQFTGTGNDLDFHGPYTTRERVITLAARLRFDVTSWLDVSASFGGTLDMERIAGFDRHTFGWHYGAGIGVKVWQSDHQAVRIDVAGSMNTFNPDGDDLMLTQVTLAAGYAWTF